MKPLPHQIEGMKALIKNKCFILGDEMGTGKTLTALWGAQWLIKRGKAKQFLAVVPAALVDNWNTEARRIGLRPLVYHGPKRKAKLLTRATYIITTYETLVRDIERFADLSSDLILTVDEAHYLKESDSNRTRQVKRLVAAYKWPMTGTAICNRPEDLYSLIDFIRPDLAGTKKEWWAKFVKEKMMTIYTRRGGTITRWKPVGVLNLPQLTELLNRVMLRRTKKDIKFNIGKRVIYQRYELDPQTRRLMKMMQAELQDSGQQLSKVLIRLQQVLDGVIKREDDEGNVIGVDYFYSTKAKILNEMLQGRSGRVIVWFRYEESLSYLAKRWKDLPIYIHSGKNQSSRLKEVQRWKASDDGILFATIKSAGVGLNLTEADTCIFYSYEFSPAENQQAEARIHRIGQTQECSVYYLYGKKTLEEAVLDLLVKKKKTNAAVITGKVSKKSLEKIYSYQLSLFGDQKKYNYYMESLEDE